ncbi:hypothetical protein [Notoacmeibacter sp. MSK16QG-6]|uniref:hypothetical protein n=1 Tax=Notoacmeibacter sp. MSK16QG-6 TaxID=2957982 RepID=UPI00209C9A8C|nr:hypothetical protein [Notoacmeibacter sp. MSK16QG-6]MCP1200070.1 hypothetical protein [Notoacmeibacter sp. MSK16QG-6]
MTLSPYIPSAPVPVLPKADPLEVALMRRVLIELNDRAAIIAESDGTVTLHLPACGLNERLIACAQLARAAVYDSWSEERNAA